MIYFVNVIRTFNTGDKRSSPFLYYSKYFARYEYRRVDLNQLKDQNIEPEDFVIIGGGGIMNASQRWNEQISFALNRSKRTIIWGAGFNSSKKQISFPSLDLSSALLVGVRDYYHPYLKFIPCASCKSRYFDQKYQIKREIGIIKHYSRKIPLDNTLNSIDFIYNNSSFKQIIKYIGESECILSDSYHALYWSSLLKKKTGRLNKNFNSRFNDCMYQYPIVNNIADISKCKILQLSGDDLTLFRQLNDQFFDRIKMNIDFK